MPDQNQQITDTNQITNPPVSDQGTLDMPNSAEMPEPILPPMEDIAAPENAEDNKDNEADKSDDPTIQPDLIIQPDNNKKDIAIKPESGQSANPDGVVAKIIEKIADSRNILIAMSANPSVDEIASAIGLSLFLDKLGKRATAIYSGATPNALEFLKPEETFEPSADALQDFVIAINKEKADHLRYKLDGDYVRIYITPYKTKVSKDDLEFSYGDFNVDLVLALNVPTGVDLDQALREHGRIMHDATIIDITTGNPGKLGEIEWSDKTASSISEMLSKLIYDMDTKEKLSRDEATAFLTGIIASTNRFSGPNTSAETMRIASKLMESGADQQLISKNINTKLENELYDTMTGLIDEKIDPTALDIEHMGEDVEPSAAPVEDIVSNEATAPTEDQISTNEETPIETPDSTESLIDQPADVTTDSPKDTIKDIPADNSDFEIDHSLEPEASATTEEDSNTLQDLEPTQDNLSTISTETVPEPSAEVLQIPDDNQNPEEGIRETKEKVIAPSPDFDANNETKYGKMLEDALTDPSAPVPTPETPPMPPIDNPAASVAPTVNTEPDVTNLPDINYAADGDMLLPPPPTPPIDFDANSLPTPPDGPAPDMPTPPMPTPGAMPPDFDPSSFQIPGM